MRLVRLFFLRRCCLYLRVSGKWNFGFRFESLREKKFWPFFICSFLPFVRLFIRCYLFKFGALEKQREMEVQTQLNSLKKISSWQTKKKLNLILFSLLRRKQKWNYIKLNFTLPIFNVWQKKRQLLRNIHLFNVKKKKKKKKKKEFQ